MEESRIEKYLKKQVEKLGGKAYKWNPTGVVGVPDRMVLLPGGKVIFVELKAPGEKLRKIQEYRAKELRKLGFQVECLDTIEKVDSFIAEVIQDLDIIKN